MSEIITYEDLLKAKEDYSLEVGETYEFTVDSYRTTNSEKGSWLFLNLVVSDGAKVGAKVEQFGPSYPAESVNYGRFEEALRAFDLTIQSAADEAGCIDSSEQSLDRLGEYLTGQTVRGRVGKPKNGQTNVFLLPAKSVS